MTGNLAVVFDGGSVNVAIFTAASGQPSTYAAHTDAVYCGYDDAGNLFVSGSNNKNSTDIAELPNGQPNFQMLSISGKVGRPGQVQWDGNQMTVESRTKSNIAILRLEISGSTATVVGTTRLKSVRGNAYQSWLYNGDVLVPYGNHGVAANNIGLWKYPQGGKAETRYRHFGRVSLWGVTVSVPQAANQR